MPNLTPAETLAFIADAVSIVLGVVALMLAVLFYLAGRGTEQRVASSLTKIEAQTDVLQKITKTQLDRLTRFATERPIVEPTRPADLVMQLIEVAQPLILLLRQQPQDAVGDDPEHLRPAVTNCHIALYYYSALANFFAQTALPNVDDFDETNAFHTLARRAVDSSNVDFGMMAGILGNTGQEALRSSELVNLLNEAQTTWRPTVSDSAGVWLARAHQNAGE